MAGTFWAFVPALVAIILALISKKVYLSLFVGILTGAMFLAGGNPLEALGVLYTAMAEKVGENVCIIVFLVMLGILVILMQRSGGTRAYGDWMKNRIKTKKGVQGATALLGCLIFVDDYFNCLTVGSVMRPLTDEHKVSRAKLAYLIDATAAPICIIAPISSWAAAVAGELDGNGLVVFMRTIPFNVYALLTIVMVFAFIFLKMEFGGMRKCEQIAETTGDVTAGLEPMSGNEEQIEGSNRGKVRHIVVPIVILILCCVGAMLYTGGFPNENNFINAFSNCSSGLSLAIGSTITVLLVCIYYAIDRVVSFNDMMEAIPQGFKAMVPAILILTLAWTISGIMGAKGGYLDAKAFVNNNISGSGFPTWIYPTLFFILACGIAFSTGTSWGTFGVLVPIAVTLLGGKGNDTTLMILTISATLGGAVFGDHVSPISDTTILASTGANCNHISHVRTQLPYAGVIAVISAIAYLITGLLTVANLGDVVTCLIMWAIVLTMFVGVVVFIKLMQKRRDKVVATADETATSEQVEETTDEE
ncbi:MAG: Na+/H+ antiporter NhaC family protein [Clostridia bacterium]|nr:Na+/H+ antiporter NhaC family protein [Clostridia bacterium]